MNETPRTWKRFQRLNNSFRTENCATSAGTQMRTKFTEIEFHSGKCILLNKIPVSILLSIRESKYLKQDTKV